jgi:hypothetical protein
MAESVRSNQRGVVAIVVVVLAVLAFMLLRGGEEAAEPGLASDSPAAEAPAPRALRDPGSVLPSNPSARSGRTSEMEPGDADLDSHRASESPQRRTDAGDSPAGGDAAAGSSRIGDADIFDPGVDREKARVKKELARARATAVVTAGIRAAQANPGLPPELAQRIQPGSPVSTDLEEAGRGVNLAPPEILDILRADPETPPEIAQAMADAEARETSEEFRAYMMGETTRVPNQ